jgi:hypothetical protein
MLLESIKLALIYGVVESRELLVMLQQWFLSSSWYDTFLEKIPNYHVTITSDGFIVEREEDDPRYSDR